MSHHRVLKGVAHRREELRGEGDREAPGRPPYVHQVPLAELPVMRPRLRERGRDQLGHDIYIMHLAAPDQLERVFPSSVVAAILQVRRGEVKILPGGGGRYGRWQLA